MQPTIGVEFKSKIFDVLDKRVKATIWDTAGAERYRTITANYYRGSHAIIFVYDVTERSSFENIEKFWLKEIREYFPVNSEVILMLVGNKIDNEYSRKVTEDEGDELARKHGMLFIETSAKERVGIQEAFEEVVNKVLESPMVDEATLKKGSTQAPGAVKVTASNAKSDHEE